LRDLLDKRLVIVTGKGGVGKSTVALALGLAGAERGKRTIVCEVSAQERLSRVFHRASVGFSEVEMEDNLWAISIDPDESMREYVLLQLKVRAMRDLLFRSKIFTYLAAATPGLRELVTIGKIWELAQDDRKVKKGHNYDLVIVDAPATGHGVGFLQTPRTFANVARVGPIASQAETLDLTSEVGVAVDRIFCNGLYPERFSEDDEQRIESAFEGAEDGARPALRAALSVRRRAVAQREQLARLEELTEASVTTMPFVFEPELGTEHLRELAASVNE
jgi:anion-transporting  ArsA/GET3 family ATPase